MTPEEQEQDQAQSAQQTEREEQERRDDARSVLTVTINLPELIEAREEGSMLVFNQNAENGIIKLLEMHKKVSDAIQYVQDEIVRQGLSYNENFTSVSGDLIKANYSASGARFKEDNEAPTKHHKAPFWKKKVTYAIDADAVEAYEMKHKGKLPVGIVKPQRNRSLRFNVKEARS